MGLRKGKLLNTGAVSWTPGSRETVRHADDGGEQGDEGAATDAILPRVDEGGGVPTMADGPVHMTFSASFLKHDRRKCA